MPKDKPVTIDFAQRDGFKQILPLEPILSSHEAGWEGIHFAHYRQPTLSATLLGQLAATKQPVVSKSIDLLQKS